MVDTLMIRDLPPDLINLHLISSGEKGKDLYPEKIHNIF